MRKRGLRRALAACTTVLAMTALGTAQADPIPPAFTISMGTNPVDMSDDSLVANADGSFTLSGQGSGGPQGQSPTWDLQWNLTIKEDPFIIGSLTITNLSTTVRTFRVGLSLPVSPAFSPSRFGGSVSATLLDFNGNGAPADGMAALAPSSDSGGSIYRGTIDGNTWLSLLGFNVTCGPGGPGCSFNGSDSDGLPGAISPGPGVASTIGTLLYFTLTPGDRVTFQTNFTVEPVPLPAALPLLVAALGTLGAGRYLSRRKFPGPLV